MKQLITKFKLASVFILVLLLGCETDDNVLLPQILSSFTYTLDEDTGTVEFINISEKATSYEWDFGDGETSTEINPIKTYVASGTYTITLTAANTAGATSTFEDEITIVIKDPITLPITFDETNVNYALGVSTFTGAAFEIVDNPDVSGTNDKSSKVGKITNGGAAFEGIYFDLGTPIDLSTDQTIKANFWSEEPIDVLMKLELGTGSDTEVTASHGGTGWETISFNFSSTESYSRITLFVDGPGTTSGDFFIDDVEQAETVTTSTGCADTPVAAASVPVDFEGCETFLSSENFGDGITSGLAQNPDKTGINTSDFVLQVDKPTGSSFFAGIQNTFENNFDLTTTDVFKLKVYSTKANVVFRFELALNPQTDPVTGNPAPVFVTIPNANEWTEVEVNFTGLPGGPTAYNQLVIKPDNDEVDSPITEDGTYYIDDITLGTSSGGGGGGGASLDDCGGDLVNDFETDTDAIFDNFGGGVGTIIDNPDTSVNTSAKVGQYVKNAGEVFGGVTIEVDPDIDFDSGVFSIDVYSEAVRQLLFKLEGLNIEVVVPTSGTGWETLTYDFSSVGGNVGSVTAITLIMDNGTQGDGSADWTIQFDNIRLCSNNAGGGGGGGGPTALSSLPADFESGEEFGGVFEPASVDGSITANPVSGGINTSANVYTFNKPAGTEFYGGMENVFAAPLDLTTTRTFRVKVYSTKPNIIVQFELQSRPNDGSVPNYSIQQTVTNANEWVELTFDFGAVVPGSFNPSIYNAIVIIPDFDPGNNPTATSETYYIDDLILE
ncbi:MAG: PKD domain-containing protein [Muricauda sp. TMED12]|nr:MAG: PKD domain-containing protein [Muricauda sp. TMED12]|tara:strand:- start:50895 stop:53234 length:2340 start_codon:yes stop_codon:yes gene_type:complete